MTKPNHIKLGALNVAELTRLFQESFGFCIEELRGMGKFPVLLGSDDFFLILTLDKKVTVEKT